MGQKGHRTDKNVYYELVCAKISSGGRFLMVAKLGFFQKVNFELCMVTMATRCCDWSWIPTSFQNKTHNVLIHAQPTFYKSHSSLYQEKTLKKWRN